MLRSAVVVASAAWLATAMLRAQPAAAPASLSRALTPASAVLQAPASSTSGAGRIDFATQIRPILAEYCDDCHDAETRKGGLSVATYVDLLDGGRSGAVIRPGASGASLLVHRLTGEVEPSMPKDDDPLDPGRLALIRAWIDQGARATPTSPPAPQPWDAPLTLTGPSVPPAIWAEWKQPVDRLVAQYLVRTGGLTAPPQLVSDERFARRVFLDITGLLPEPAALDAFLADRSADKRARLVDALLDDDDAYAEHWMTFWNDLLRNEDGVSYFAERDGRKSITPWLLDALRRNRRYDDFVRALLNPSGSDDPEGFLIGVNWRGETSAAVTPWMQASQNTAQVFLGVNMKCNACHDSFVSRWKLKDAYGLAAYFSPEPHLQLYRCDVARDEYTGPTFPFPELQARPRSDRLEHRRAAAARLFTDERNGRMPRTIVNRIWERLLGHGIVANSDEMDTQPWSPELLDWLASDFVDRDYDLKHLIRILATSKAYQIAAVPRTGEPSPRGYVFRGPEVRRLTAEQFADAVGSLTGEWSTWPGPPPRAAAKANPRSTSTPRAVASMRMDSDPVAGGEYAREWRAASNSLTRALGRPIRDQVTSVRPDDATTPQALELVNGERLSAWLERGARRLTGDLPPDTYSRFTAAVAGRNARARGFDLDVSGATTLWLVVQDIGSNVPERVQPVWADAVFTDAVGAVTRLSSLVPSDGDPPRRGQGEALHVQAPSVLRYDIAGRRFVRFRGVMDLANPRAEIGATLNPAVRFFVFDAEPDTERLQPPRPTPPLRPPARTHDAREIVDRIFRQALAREPTDAERRIAERAVLDTARPGRLSPDGVADVLWAVLMKPEFQLIY